MCLLWSLVLIVDGEHWLGRDGQGQFLPRPRSGAF